MGVRVVILGATGAVGREMLRQLELRDFPVNGLRLLSGARGAGTPLTFRGETIVTEKAENSSFQGAELVLGAAKNQVAQEFAPAIRKAGAVFIDNSSAFRMDPEVPLVVPEINGGDAAQHKGIIANPNCSTAIGLTAIGGLCRLAKLEAIVASTYQAVSGAGAGGLGALEAEMRGEVAENGVFPYKILGNLIPKIGDYADYGYTAEEMKLQNEGRKILHLPELRASCTCVRVPVARCHALSLACRFDRPISRSEARAAIAAAPGCRLVEGPEAYPMPLNTGDQDLVTVGRIRPGLTDPRGLSLFCCGDQLRKGAATNAIQIAELLF